MGRRDGTIRGQRDHSVSRIVELLCARLQAHDSDYDREQAGVRAVTHAGEVVLRNDRQWVQFWSEHHPHEPAPEVDFSKDMVVGVFAGPRPADAFKIRIENVRPQAGSLAVDYREVLPPPGTFAVDVTVYPYHLKVIPKTSLTVKFKKLELINPNR